MTKKFRRNQQIWREVIKWITKKPRHLTEDKPNMMKKGIKEKEVK